VSHAPLSPLEEADLVAFVACSDLEASSRFYGEVLGLRLLETSGFAIVYDVRGTQLRVTLVDRPARAPYSVLGWRVRDIAGAIRGLRAVGVEFKRYDGMTQDEHDVWTAPGGSRIAWFADPDGNLISLQQPPSI
jgi:catechol 2,3-dioxygenase-like lactoylglutathione lyase family enzyme